MGAPPGNQYAKGCTTSGAPRTVSPPPEEVIALGKEMLEWVIANNPIHLNEWYLFEKGIIYKDWKALIQLKEFLPYYEIALGYVGRHYIKKDTDIEPNLKQRWQRIYFKDLRDQEDEDLDRAAERDVKKAVQGTDDQIKALETMLSWLKTQQNKEPS